jgi:hypothetical protein
LAVASCIFTHLIEAACPDSAFKHYLRAQGPHRLLVSRSVYIEDLQQPPEGVDMPLDFGITAFFLGDALFM